MRSVHNNKMATVVASLAFFGLCVTATVPVAAAPLIFDRGLPTANLNNAAGSNRSNVAWGDLNPVASIGDNFTLGGTYVLDTLRVWVVDTTGTAPAANGYQLWLGNDAGASTTVANSGVSSTSVTKVTYGDGSTYQGGSGNLYDIYQVDFSGLNLGLYAGTYAFAVSGVPGATYVDTPFLHASNAGLSGSTQDGADGLYYEFDATGALAGGAPIDSNGNGWDKSSDINVQVFGTVPEPASLALLGLGLAGLGVMRRRRKA